eukprot:5932168-Ditylum_brightwellii.AAC.1
MSLSIHAIIFFQLLPSLQIVHCSLLPHTNNFHNDLNEIASPSPPLYQACAPLIYGQQCQNRCTCLPNQDCNDGPSGDGSCTCPYGSWNVTCFGESSPLIPEGEEYWIPGFYRREQRQLMSLSVEDIPSFKKVRKVDVNLVHVLPTPLKGTPKLLSFNEDTANKIGWMSDHVSSEKMRAICDCLQNNTSNIIGNAMEKGEQLATELAQALSGSVLLP